MGKKKQKPLDFLEGAEKNTEDNYIKFLEEKGYIISFPQKDAQSLETIDDLLNFFYSSMYKYNADRKIRFTPMHEDRKFISNFIKSRQIGGVSKKTALLECAKIIDALFKYEKNFELSFPITSTTILCQEWVVNKAISILNSEDKYEEEKFNAEIDSIMESLVDTDEFQNKVKKDLDNIYRNMGLNNGKEEK